MHILRSTIILNWGSTGVALPERPDSPESVTSPVEWVSYRRFSVDSIKIPSQPINGSQLLCHPQRHSSATAPKFTIRESSNCGVSERRNSLATGSLGVPEIVYKLDLDIKDHVVDHQRESVWLMRIRGQWMKERVSYDKK